ncbi:MAG: hypothetical protein C4K49_08255 [Candidatus Thorarchaeota archaeon]|nr:MAG: hypothetical protein C4K49_08255 [Candidatus Thorarchaeota archaeon]
MAREKLIRDLVPDAIRAEGGSPVVRIASEQEMDRLLRQKIVEEAQEFLLSGDTAEIADILEAVRTLLNLRCVGWRRIEALRKQKRVLRGGFERGYVLSLGA